MNDWLMIFAMLVFLILLSLPTLAQLVGLAKDQN